MGALTAYQQAHQEQAVATAPFAFARLYDGWMEMAGDARAGVRRSVERYLAHLRRPDPAAGG